METKKELQKEKIIKLLQKYFEKNFYGNLTFNFNCGTIVNIKVEESLKIESLKI